MPKDKLQGGTAFIKLMKKADCYVFTLLKSELFRGGAINPQSLRTFNRFIVIAIAALGIYLFFDIILTNPSRKAISTIGSISVSGREAAAPISEKSAPIDMKTYAFYSNRIGDKPLFGAPAEPEAYDEASTVSDEIGLVGILTGNSPQAIIEDRKSQKTYYISRGQTVNGITVEEIGDGIVRLDNRGTKTTLSL